MTLENPRPGNAGETPAARAVRQNAESARRSIAKTVSWRIVGSLDTLFLSFVILSLLGPLFGMEPASHASNARTAGVIALAEVFTKIALYYVHERVWARSRWHIVMRTDGQHRATAARSVTKAATWRITASIDTTVLAFIFTGNIGTALSIGGIEAITKIGLYYVHERVWARIPWGALG